MEFTVKTGSPDKPRTGCIVLGVFEGRKLSAAGQAIDAASRGHIAEVLKSGDLEGKIGGTLLLHKVPRVGADRVLLVGLGRERDLAETQFRAALTTATRVLRTLGAADVTFPLSTTVKGRDIGWMAEQVVLAVSDANYRFDRMKSKPPAAKRAWRKTTIVAGSKADVAAAERGVARGDAIGQGIALAKDLGNLPGNVCTPTYLAEQAQELAKRHGMKAEILERKDMERLGMGSFLSVAQGSVQPPKLIVLEYRGGARNEAPVALVGKGITFDTGGISLKPGAERDEMKIDMSGAASVLGTMKAISRMELALNVVGVVPTTENMPGGNAIKPGDIVKTMSGQTVEILNTDAEGRLILCDALTYVEKYKPAAVVDIATLTGAMVIALGHVATGLFANSDPLARELVQAGEGAWDRAWHLPMWDDYQEQLKSNFADFPNIGSRAGGSITAACFLSRFAKAYPWAHLDIAGTAWKSGAEKGATGRPVPLLAHFLARRAAAA
jgi:leucyl aminopeptidase